LDAGRLRLYDTVARHLRTAARLVAPPPDSG
jgi:hypothetical protein